MRQAISQAEFGAWVGISEARVSQLMAEGVLTRGEYAPITLLAEVLATASQSVSERFEQLPGLLRKVCPELPDTARDKLMSAIADARNQWVRATARLVTEAIVQPEEGEEEEGEPL